MTKNLFKIFIFVDTFIILICIGTENYLWLINIQVAFISSFIISMATFYSYKNNVDKSVSYEIEKQENDLDYIDKIDDPYDLYSDEVVQEINETPTKEEIKEAMKPIKSNHLQNLRKSLLSFASLYRIIGYAILIFGFFYLNNNGYFHVYSYLIGFLLIPISSLFSKVKGISKNSY